jgi:hypothetical protein
MVLIKMLMVVVIVDNQWWYKRSTIASLQGTTEGKGA